MGESNSVLEFYWVCHPFPHWHLLIFFPIKPLFPQTRTKWTVTFSDEAEASRSIWQSVNGKHDWTGGEFLPLSQSYPQTKSQLSPEPPHMHLPLCHSHSLPTPAAFVSSNFHMLDDVWGILMGSKWGKRMRSQDLSGFCIFECTFNSRGYQVQLTNSKPEDLKIIHILKMLNDLNSIKNHGAAKDNLIFCVNWSIFSKSGDFFILLPRMLINNLQLKYWSKAV